MNDGTGDGVGDQHRGISADLRQVAGGHQTHVEQEKREHAFKKIAGERLHGGLT